VSAFGQAAAGSAAELSAGRANHLRLASNDWQDMNLLDAVLVFCVALLAGIVLTPIAARWAHRLGAVDAPDGGRKHQQRPVPLGGGVAVALSVCLSLIISLAWADLSVGTQLSDWLRGAVPSVLVLITVGLIDDSIGLTGIYKLIGQMLAVSLLVAGGFRFESISLLGWSFGLGDFGIPFSIFFCLGAINAFNLIDGADGLAACIGAVVCLTLGVITAAQSMVIAAPLSFAVSGALIGFLRYNAPPAKVYLGDTGSMLIGWVVAAVAIRSSIKEQAAVALTVPIAICAIPILDAAAAMIRRVTTGQSVFTADRGHLHHALLLRGWSVGQTAILASGLTAITCAGAIASYFTRRDAFALGSAIGVFALLAATRVFGHAELALLASHARSLFKSWYRVLRPSANQGPLPADHAIQLQGRRQWKVVWSALREAAPVHNLAGLKLNVNIPDLHESFYAAWKRPGGGASDGTWRLTVPLMYRERTIGKLSILGGSVGSQALADVQHFLDFLEPLDEEIARLVEDRSPQVSVAPPIRAANSSLTGSLAPAISG
jgi:UDP-GlcNAc:undecaprenyl-phosphate GlcNAc-1-phosphate transferase